MPLTGEPQPGEASYAFVLAVLDIRHAAYDNGDRVFQVSCLIHYVGLHDRWQPKGPCVSSSAGGPNRVGA